MTCLHHSAPQIGELVFSSSTEIVALEDPCLRLLSGLLKYLLSGKVELSALRCTTNPVTWVSLSFPCGWRSDRSLHPRHICGASGSIYQRLTCLRPYFRLIYQRLPEALVITRGFVGILCTLTDSECSIVLERSVLLALLDMPESRPESFKRSLLSVIRMWIFHAFSRHHFPLFTCFVCAKIRVFILVKTPLLFSMLGVH